MNDWNEPYYKQLIHERSSSRPITHEHNIAPENATIHGGIYSGAGQSRWPTHYTRKRCVHTVKDMWYKHPDDQRFDITPNMQSTSTRYNQPTPVWADHWRHSQWLKLRLKTHSDQKSQSKYVIRNTPSLYHLRGWHQRVIKHKENHMDLGEQDLSRNTNFEIRVMLIISSPTK